MQVNATQEERLLEMTRAMLVSAQAANWEQLAELEHSRLVIFNQVFSKGIDGKEKLAEEILSVDKKTQQLAEARMPDLRHELSMINNSGKANQAYKSIQNLDASEG